MSEWQDLTEMTRGEAIRIERVRLVHKGIRIEGDFELPPLARLTFEDQVFIASFVRCHGSIKEMEASFGISYPTVKNRLNKIANQLGFVTAEPGDPTPGVTAGTGVSVPTPEALKPGTGGGAGGRGNGPANGLSRRRILEQLERGEITPDQAVEALKRC